MITFGRSTTKHATTPTTRLSANPLSFPSIFFPNKHRSQ